MNICLIMDNPETPRHPVIAVALQQLSTRHTVRLLDVRTLTGDEAIAQEATHSLADLYLLKSHAPQALDLALHMEQQGAMVVNSWASSTACQNRAVMTQCMNDAHLPWPRSRHFMSLESLLAQQDILEKLPFPLIIKSHYSHRGDLVDKVRSLDHLRSLAAQWGQEPIILQEFVAGDGWDIKLWVIDRHIFAARRRTPLDASASAEDYPITAHELPQEWADITLAVGKAFNLRLYGVDLLITERGPMIVDVNSFPGFRGVPGADTALANFIEQLLTERKATV